MSEFQLPRSWWGGVRFVIFGLYLFLGYGFADAQPQAPVVWSETRWLGLDSVPTVSQVVPMGDTLALCGIDGGQALSYTAYSYNNGMTVSDWQLVQSLQPENNAVQLAGSEGRVLLVRIYTGSVPWQSWIRISSDGGASWTSDRYSMTGGHRYVFLTGLLGASIRTNVADGIRSAITTNAGETWQPEVIVPQGDTLSTTIHSLAISQQSLILLAHRMMPSPIFHVLMYSTSSDTGMSWSTMEEFPGLPTQSGSLNSYSIAADHLSSVAIASTTWYPGFSTPQELWMHRTTDGGQTWEDGRRLTDSATVRLGAEPVMFCRGKLWGIAWPDVRGEGLPDLQWKFSANHGRDWYPEQIVALEVRGVWETCGQFDGDSVKLYRIENTDQDGQLLDVRTVSGAIESDITPPEIFPEIVPNDSVNVGDTLSFVVSASDNDTLSSVRMILERIGEEQVVVEFLYASEFMWEANWYVEQSGNYQYSFEAEDFWENIGFLADTSTFRFVTRGLSTHAHPEFVQTWAVEVYPNPANLTPILRLSESWFEHGDVAIRALNLLGQEVGRMNLVPSRGQSGILVLDPVFQNVTSGVYLLVVHNAIRHTAVKALILR